MREIFGKQVYTTIGEIVASRHTALILVDPQNDFCSPNGYFAKVAGLDISQCLAIIPRISRLVEEARKAGVLVVFVQNTVFEDGRTDSPPILRFRTGVAAGNPPSYTIDGTWGHQFVDELAPRKSEPVVKKHRPGAFHRTDLNLILHANGIESIVVTGVVTEGCVQATAIDGLFYDYYVVVARDCVGSTVQEDHDAALKFLGPRRADVVDSSDIIKEWVCTEK